jgi:hypothetical protein
MVVLTADATLSQIQQNVQRMPEQLVFYIASMVVKLIVMDVLSASVNQIQQALDVDQSAICIANMDK